jgi:hypothetical protein
LQTIPPHRPSHVPYLVSITKFFYWSQKKNWQLFFGADLNNGQCSTIFLYVDTTSGFEHITGFRKLLFTALLAVIFVVFPRGGVNLQ